jgi:hypothetical protein
MPISNQIVYKLSALKQASNRYLVILPHDNSPPAGVDCFLGFNPKSNIVNFCSQISGNKTPAL